MSWSDLSIHCSTDTAVGCIVTTAPIESKTLPEYTVRESKNITSADVSFIADQHSDSYAVLDPTLSLLCQSNIINLYTGASIVGFILAIPHRISLKGDKIYNCGLSTHLCIHKSHRHKKLAMVLIQSLIYLGYKNNMSVGYHYMNSPKTLSNIATTAFYRPLNIRSVIAKGYQVPIPKIKGVRDVHRLATLLYSTKITHKYRPTVLSDFDILIQRQVSIAKFTTEEWSRFNKQPLIWTTVLNDKKPLIVCAYRPFIIHNKHGIVNAIQLVYIETSSTDSKDICAGINTFMSIITQSGYEVIHGIIQGPLVDISAPLKLIPAAVMYLDFYNLSVGVKVAPSHVSMLYI